jgi:4-alpha-glucanotransferase
MIKAAARSVAALCIFPLQDILHLGSEARMNTPAAGEGNWTWRYASNALHPDFTGKLAALMEMTDRDGVVVPVVGDVAAASRQWIKSGEEANAETTSAHG